jgi:ribosome-associated protein
MSLYANEGGAMPRDISEIKISAGPIEIYKVLKLANLVASGSATKHGIAQCFVRVSGRVETKKRKQIYIGDVVEFSDSSFTVRV